MVLWLIHVPCKFAIENDIVVLCTIKLGLPIKLEWNMGYVPLVYMIYLQSNRIINFGKMTRTLSE